MSFPRPLRDHLFVQVDTKALGRTPSGLYIPDWQPGDKDAQLAQVLALPASLSDRRLGFPDMDGRAYLFRDLADLPAVGDTVYLKPNTFQPQWEYPGHPGVFLVPLDKVIAYSHISLDLADVVVPFQGLLLCEPVYGDDVRMGDKGVRERLQLGEGYGHNASFVVEVDPLPIPFVLRVRHTGPPLRAQPDLVRAGEVVLAHKMLFAYHAVANRDGDAGEGRGRWCWQPSQIVIDGHEYAYIPRQCVMAKPLAA